MNVVAKFAEAESKKNQLLKKKVRAGTLFFIK